MQLLTAQSFPLQQQPPALYSPMVSSSSASQQSLRASGACHVLASTCGEAPPMGSLPSRQSQSRAQLNPDFAGKSKLSF